MSKLTVSRLDFPCSRAFRQWEASQEGLDLPDIDTRPEWEQEFDRQHPVDRDGYSLDFLAMMERVKPGPYGPPAKAGPAARKRPMREMIAKAGHIAREAFDGKTKQRGIPL